MLHAVIRSLNISYLVHNVLGAFKLIYINDLYDGKIWVRNLGSKNLIRMDRLVRRCILECIGMDEICVLVGFYASYNGSYRRFGTTYRSHL